MNLEDIREGYDKSGWDEEISQLVEQLKAAERDLPFVGLDWFRNEFLPQCGHPWAKDAERNEALLKRAIQQRLILTWRCLDPGRSPHPVKAIRVRRSHDLLPWDWDGGPVATSPIKIKGGPISDTVIEDRTDRV